MDKKIIENFYKQEREIKATLLKEIKKEFDSYNKDIVIVDNNEFQDYGFDYDILVQYYINVIDGADDYWDLPESLSYENKELVLKIHKGSNSLINGDRIAICDLSIEGLQNLLYILQDSTTKEANKVIEVYKHYDRLLSKYGEMKICCPSQNDIEITLKELLNSITTDKKDDAIQDLCGRIEAGFDEEQIVYETFVIALLHNAWFNKNGIDYDSHITITSINNKILFDDNMENLENY